MSLEDFIQGIIDLHTTLGKATHGGVDLANLKPVLEDATMGAKLLVDFGLTGKYSIKTVNGVDYIIFKGRAGLRTFFQGTRYRADNPKVRTLNLGFKNLMATVGKTTILAVIIYVSIDVATYILEDDETLSEMLGHLGVDIGVAAASGLIGSVVLSALGGIVGTFLSVALSPVLVVVAGLAAGIIAAVVLNEAATAYDWRQKLTDVLEVHCQALERRLVAVREIIRDATVSLRNGIERHERLWGQTWSDFFYQWCAHDDPFGNCSKIRW